MEDVDRERYPVGRLPRNSEPLDAEGRAALISVIAQAPSTLRMLVGGLTDAQLDTPYRAGGWTIRQVIHHLPDSHMNAYVRMKRGLTESAPLVAPYDEALWAELPEARTAPVVISLDLLDALHRRWVAFLSGIAEGDFRRTYTHPELGVVTIDQAVALYAWHCRHHTAHVKLGIQRAG
jgi:hypothetical protein